MAVGFTLTNSDEYEFGCANHLNRVSAMDYLHSKGFKTWASIEPIISIKKSIQAIADTLNICDLYKIGLESGAKYDRKELYAFYDWVGYYIQSNNNYAKVYFKDSFINRLQLNRDVLGDFCVKRDYNFWL
jgi:DNA repair photolyase